MSYGSVRLDFARALMKARLSTHCPAHFRIVLLLGHGVSPFNYSYSVSRSAERRSTRAGVALLLSSLKYLSEFVSAPAFYLSAEKLVGSMK